MSIRSSNIAFADNGSRLDAGRELEAQKLIISRMLNRITEVELTTNALLAFKPMLGDCGFSRSLKCLLTIKYKLKCQTKTNQWRIIVPKFTQQQITVFLKVLMETEQRI